ncbi:MAG: hypothetical protein KZQ66_01945 [Candidatus Thiodiazotropha sp. (ex Lucinoma aequizonata)]|nr:hypothetical protein [Candidatus Thiodiazotropha sp. (ex Lucinoma aequizonata)]MCU7895225.1 hypothetical protein [Candidatus Thiodiazotropha sp. (ex Lucinoma aequizonata)]MCU7899239.1 hypothetical protein [Candidatus Thiodiazotropha sp. (ex Lucinoma aequizonata)]MCU7900923.1 hypothetical protein [Candidatus Thiodiazotropha sp. (ex Lucinoma aequizonata)]MCU7908046.1 hypothetical protein [Candidatus Thiodiazotropha sp. (ex Lucinoma aequizonata)]
MSRKSFTRLKTRLERVLVDRVCINCDDLIHDGEGIVGGNIVVLDQAFDQAVILYRFRATSSCGLIAVAIDTYYHANGNITLGAIDIIDSKTGVVGFKLNLIN